ncbi:type-IV secretion system protein TraC [Rouxiella silvae]|uniref:Type-IV secretion system protein TraC n=1 Tax=Rouxiella silvae TaxID=1646373 RepID=A0ABX3TVH2_9GAMM|nr:type IV secretion system protein TraC [Rouxiella silvae]ORJ19222.1 type-IV secretion system protein TraC [Rouxiella silvae]
MPKSLLDTITRMISGSKYKEDADAARKSLQQFDYPSLTALLPYRVYDDVTDLYINKDTAGFIFEIAPLSGANEDIIAAIDDVFRRRLPRKTPVAIYLIASKCVSEVVSAGVSEDMWQGIHKDRLNAITKAFFERAALKGFHNKKEMPLYLRNYRVFAVVGKKTKINAKTMSELSMLRETLRVSFQASKLHTHNLPVGEFLSVMRELHNYRPGQTAKSSNDYDDHEELHRQIIDASNELEVFPDYLRLTTRRHHDDKDINADNSGVVSTRIVNLQISKNPRQFALWQTPDNLHNIRFTSMGIPCPFMITWGIEVDDQMSSQSESFRKEQDLAKKANSAYAKFIPSTGKAYEEWKSLRQELGSNSTSMCRYFWNMTLFTPDNDLDQLKCTLEAQNVLRKNDLPVDSPRFQQMRNFMATFPFVLQEGLWEDLKMSGVTKRATVYNAINLMPVVAESGLSGQGSPLPSYRNQINFFDLFSENNGSTNFNMAVTGTSGAGKSFLIQEILRQVLNSGGFATVIDMGRSYENFCKQAGGVYLDGATLRFNPFGDVTDINESAEGITMLMTVLASPDDEMDEVSEAILMKGVIAAWDKGKNKAKIDYIVDYMKDESGKAHNKDKDTIRNRLDELIVRLDRYCTHGPDGEYFNAEHPTLNADTRFAVLELLNLESKPKLLSAILFSIILAVQEKMYKSPRNLKKLCVIDEAWRLLNGSNVHAAKFIEKGYRTVRRHRGSFITITQGIRDFTGVDGAPPPAEAAAAWNNSGTKVTLMQEAKAFNDFLKEKPDFYNEVEKTVIKGFQPSLETGFSSLLISAGERSSFHRLFVDPITRAMFSSKGEHFEFMSQAQVAGATSEEAAMLLAERIYTDELKELEEWAKLN